MLCMCRCIHCSQPLVLLLESVVFSWLVTSLSTLKSGLSLYNILTILILNELDICFCF